MTKTEKATMQAQIQALQAENAALKAKPAAKLSLKVSEKGAISLYGLGRFPVTLYREQWETVAKAMPQIQEFIKANEGALSVKGEKAAA